MAQVYRSDNILNGCYILRKTYMVRTGNIELMDTMFRAASDLIADGVILSSEYGGQADSPRYMFTRLNDVKPDMIAEATRSAREAAEKFAQDSGAKVAD